jgi:hypothetical protein
MSDNERPPDRSVIIDWHFSRTAFNAYLEVEAYSDYAPLANSQSMNAKR